MKKPNQMSALMNGRRGRYWTPMLPVDTDEAKKLIESGRAERVHLYRTGIYLGRVS